MSALSPTSPTKLKEGLYQEEEGKSMDYTGRISDQAEIKQFTDSMFQSIGKNKMDYLQYAKFNN